MIIIDALGMLCPIPVVKARQEIQKLPAEGGIVQVLVDNAIACENLDKMAKHKGYQCEVEKRGDRNYAVTLTIGEGHSVPQAVAAAAETAVCGTGIVVAIGQDKMGSGSDELGKILVKGFIFALANLDVPPKAILFFNSGVKLAIEGSNTLDDLKALQQRGTIIRVCGTCVDYYNCKSQVAVGEIANMYDLVEFMSGAQNVINLG